MTTSGKTEFEERLARIGAARAGEAAPAAPAQRRPARLPQPVPPDGSKPPLVPGWLVVAAAPFLGGAAWVAGHAIAFHTVSGQGLYPIPALAFLNGFAEIPVAVMILCSVILWMGVERGSRQMATVLGFALAMFGETILAEGFPATWGGLYTPVYAQTMVTAQDLPEGFLRQFVDPTVLPGFGASPALPPEAVAAMATMSDLPAD